MLAIVVGADPNSAVYHAANGGFTLTDHLLATKERIARPGVTDLRPGRIPDIRDPKLRKMTFDSMTIEEYEARRKARLKEPA
jgi:hypothetical protein